MSTPDTSRDEAIRQEPGRTLSVPVLRTPSFDPAAQPAPAAAPAIQPEPQVQHPTVSGGGAVAEPPATGLDSIFTADGNHQVTQEALDQFIEVQDVHYDEAAIDEAVELAGQLPTRDVARAALKARLIHVSQPRERRSVHETVFILLAFAMTVLVITPPLIRLVNAIHGADVPS